MAPPLLAALAAAVPDLRQAPEVARRILSDAAYQTALPPGAPFTVFDLPLGPLALLLRALFWAAVVVGALLLVAWVRRRLRLPTLDLAAPRPAAAPAELRHAPLQAAERLAAQGRFGEAIHALLLRTFEVLAQHRRTPLAPSFTSREILERIPVPGEARAALGGLVAAVEVSHFGPARPGEEEYRSCLGAFHRFVSAYEASA